MVRTSARMAVGAVLASLILLVLAGVAAAAPSNDDFSSPMLLTGTTGSVAASNVDATLQADEPARAGHSVWFHWIAPVDGVASFSAGSGFSVDTYVGWSLSALTPLGVAAPVAAGDVLSIRVDAADPGPFTLS